VRRVTRPKVGYTPRRWRRLTVSRRVDSRNRVCPNQPGEDTPGRLFLPRPPATANGVSHPAGPVKARWGEQGSNTHCLALSIRMIKEDHLFACVRKGVSENFNVRRPTFLPRDPFRRMKRRAEARPTTWISQFALASPNTPRRLGLTPSRLPACQFVKELTHSADRACRSLNLL